MLQLRLFSNKNYDEGNVADLISIRCINCNKETELRLKDTPIEEIITKTKLNAILHHMGMSWIICSNNKILYEIEESIHPDWLDNGPWYNTTICSKLHGKIFEDFIRDARTDRYRLMCYIIAHDKKQPSYEDE